MKISRITVICIYIDVAAVLADGITPATVDGIDVALLAPGQSVTGTTVWTPTTFAGGTGSIYVVGTDVTLGGALTVPVTGSMLWARVVDSPEVDAIPVEFFTVAA